MRFRKLRIAWSVGCGIACVLLIVLWVRSYWRTDSMTLWKASPSRFAYIQSVAGRLNFCKDVMSPGEPRFQTLPLDESSTGFIRALRRCENRFGFGEISDWSLSAVIVPYWFLVLASMAITAAPWITLIRFRFSLRTMLIATTLIAVVLGLIAVAMR
jgi:hypothetical protein